MQLQVCHAVVVGQAAADAAQRSRQRGRRGGTGKFGPQFLGRQANLQRLAVHAAQLRTELLQRRVGLVGLLAPLLDLATLLFNLRRQAGLVGGQPFALGPRFFFQELTIGGQLLVELLQGRPLRFQFRFRLGQAPLPLGQGFGHAADRLILQDDGLGRLGRLFQLGGSLLQPELGRPGVAFQLCGPGIEFGLAMIEFLLPATEVLGKLRRLGLDLPRDRLGVGRRRGRLFAAPRLQIDAAVQAGRLGSDRFLKTAAVLAAGCGESMRVSATNSVTEGALLPRI